MINICKLCKKEKELQASHVIPKLLYRFMRRKQDGIKDLNGLLIINNRDRNIEVTQRQWVSSLFCKDCEKILSKNETAFARIFHDLNEMQSLDKDKIAYYSRMELLAAEVINSGKCSIDDFNKAETLNFFNKKKTDTLRYFAASFVLRQLYLIENTLGEKELKSLEDFLLGSGPAKFRLIVKVNNNVNNFNILCSTIPMDKLENFKHYIFIVPEIHFHLIFNINECDEYDESDVIILNEDLFADEFIRKIIKEQYQKANPTEKTKFVIEEWSKGS